MVCWYYDIKNDIFSVKKMVAEYDSLTGKTHRRLVEDKKSPAGNGFDAGAYRFP